MMTNTRNPQNAHAGDVGDVRTCTLSGGVADLDTVTSVSATVTHQELGTTATLAASVTDGTLKTVDVALGTWLGTAAPGKWNVTVTVVFTDASELTWPAVGQGRDVLLVYAAD
jgi:hypothetical protein